MYCFVLNKKFVLVMGWYWGWVKVPTMYYCRLLLCTKAAVNAALSNIFI